MNIMPFVYSDGVPTFSDSQLIGLFSKTVEQKLRNELFFGRFMTVVDFLRLVKSVPYFFVLVDGKDIVGYSYFTNLKETSAHIHILYFRDYRGKKAIKHAREALKEGFQFAGLDTLVGVTPASNKRAIRFAQMTGFKIVGEIEDYLWNEHTEIPETGVITKLQREVGNESL